MRRVAYVMSAVIAVVVVWAYPLKEVLDFDLDALYASQILDGLNPYELGTVPRPPSAWLLQMPLAWIDTTLFSRLTGVAAIVAVAWLAWRILELNPLWLPAFTGLTSITFLAKASVVSANMSSVIAVLFVWAWVRRSGIAVGIAAALRLYPMVWFVAVRRWSAIWTVLGFTVAGLLLVPDLGISDLIANGGMFTDHTGNGSLVRAVGLPLTLIVGAVIAWRASRVGYEQAMCLTAVCSVMVPAISWPGYHLILIPVVAWAVKNGREWVGFVPLLWVTPVAGVLGHDFGTATLIAASMILIGVWRVSGDDEQRSVPVERQSAEAVPQ